MKPSPSVLTSSGAVGPQRLPDDALVRAEHVPRPRASPRRCVSAVRALDVGEQDGAKGVGGQRLGPTAAALQPRPGTRGGSSAPHRCRPRSRAGPALEQSEAGVRYPGGKAARDVRAEPGELPAVKDQGRRPSPAEAGRQRRSSAKAARALVQRLRRRCIPALAPHSDAPARPPTTPAAMWATVSRVHLPIGVSQSGPLLRTGATMKRRASRAQRVPQTEVRDPLRMASRVGDGHRPGVNRRQESEACPERRRSTTAWRSSSWASSEKSLTSRSESPAPRQS